jgi:DNA-binding transcriptional ArsR family regulator
VEGVPLDSATRARLRARSKRVLGNADRLEVAAAVARDASGVVHAQELANALGISPPRVRSQLLAFTEAGLMQTLPRHGQIVQYQRVEDPFWETALSLYEAWG